MSKKPVVLIIRDGWGVNPGGSAKAVENGDATLLARTPFHDHLYATYPQSRLSASGMDVGLPEGQMGNSEVGHLNLGAGRIVYQDLTRINKAIADGEFGTNAVLAEAFAKAAGKDKETGGQGDREKDAAERRSPESPRLHLIGLVSDGGVHSHQEHLIALCQAATAAGVKDILIHAITDGRDTSPTSGADFLATVEKGIAGTAAKVATVIGRYFAMDRDKRWERNKLAWDAIVLGRGPASTATPSEAIRAAYPADARGDEFLQPILFSHANEQRVRDGDVVLWFNFRADRARQLTEAFMDPAFSGFATEGKPRLAGYYTLTEYKETYAALGVKAVFQSECMGHLLGGVVAGAGLKQLRAAETEKFPHVTFFFNGGSDMPFEGESRYLTLSPKNYSKDGKEAPLPTYDLMPQMSAPDLAFEVRRRLEQFDLVIVNFANPDMVGHTGVVGAGIHAVETIDVACRLLVERTLELGGKLLLTADHGNCELMRNPDGSPNTAHTTNLVHFIYVGADAAHVKLDNGILADVAPTLLDMLGVAKPAEMTGRSLIRR
jgi:2,3-bisphosphoglycerate-independent phosphoglycerate mutase